MSDQEISSASSLLLPLLHQHPKDRPLRSYGRRKGHALSPRQEDLVATVLPKVQLDISQRTESAADVAAQFSGNVLTEAPRELWLEIGFGGGEHLAAQADAHPDVGIIGCEPFVNGVVKLLDAVSTRGLTNVRVHDDDARTVLSWLPPASIDRCFILYPDPWPKKRHQKRRLVNEDTLGLVARAMQPGGTLLLATDIADYVRSMLLAVRAVPDLDWTARGADDWRTPPSGWPGTRYEAKALREGRRPHYLTFVRR